MWWGGSSRFVEIFTSFQLCKPIYYRTTHLLNMFDEGLRWYGGRFVSILSVWTKWQMRTIVICMHILSTGLHLKSVCAPTFVICGNSLSVYLSVNKKITHFTNTKILHKYCANRWKAHMAQFYTYKLNLIFDLHFTHKSFETKCHGWITRQFLPPHSSFQK